MLHRWRAAARPDVIDRVARLRITVDDEVLTQRNRPRQAARHAIELPRRIDLDASRGITDQGVRTGIRGDGRGSEDFPYVLKTPTAMGMFAPVCETGSWRADI